MRQFKKTAVVWASSVVGAIAVAFTLIPADPVPLDYPLWMGTEEELQQFAPLRKALPSRFDASDRLGQLLESRRKSRLRVAIEGRLKHLGIGGELEFLNEGCAHPQRPRLRVRC